MEYKEIINKIKPEIDKSINLLEQELSKIRTGRPSVSLVEDIEVECFGKKFKLKELGALSISDRKEILVQPWDQSYIEPIEKAISRTSLNLSPAVEGEFIRISLPPLTTEHRENLLKIIAEKKEETRQVMRRWRGDAWEKIQDFTKEGKIREDDKYRAKDELKDLVDECNEKIDKIIEKKIKDIAE